MTDRRRGRRTGPVALVRGFAVANALAQMLFMPAYPLWAVAIFSLDLLVIYGLVVRGGRKLRPA